jgi:hypothetical protein
MRSGADFSRLQFGSGNSRSERLAVKLGGPYSFAKKNLPEREQDIVSDNVSVQRFNPFFAIQGCFLINVDFQHALV